MIEEALRKIMAEVGTSTLAWKIASDALINAQDAQQVIGFYANTLNWHEDKEGNLGNIEQDDLERVNFGCSSNETDDRLQWTGGGKARAYLERYAP